MWQYKQTNELYHYGIPGMKWGHRKERYPTSNRRYVSVRDRLNDRRYGYQNQKADLQLEYNKRLSNKRLTPEQKRLLRSSRRIELNKLRNQYNLDKKEIKNNMSPEEKADRARKRAKTMKTMGKAIAIGSIAAIGAYTYGKYMKEQSAKIQAIKNRTAFINQKGLDMRGNPLAPGYTADQYARSIYDITRGGRVNSRTIRNDTKQVLEYLGTGGSLKSLPKYDRDITTIPAGELLIKAIREQIKNRRG